MPASEDPNREIRTMILAILPYPPLPVMVTRVDADSGVLADDAVTTSHTFVAKILDEALARNDFAINSARKGRQMRVFQEFLHVMASEGFACDMERLYIIFCRFTLEHIGTFFPPGHPLDMRFQPFSYTTKGDRVHAKVAEYLAAQSIFYEDNPPITREQYLCYEYPEMLKVVRDRLGHVMTTDERARLDAQAARDDSDDDS
jgi:hypothetical protein